MCVCVFRVLVHRHGCLCADQVMLTLLVQFYPHDEHSPQFARSQDPRFAQQNPRMVRIRTLRQTYIQYIYLTGGTHVYVTYPPVSMDRLNLEATHGEVTGHIISSAGTYMTDADYGVGGRGTSGTLTTPSMETHLHTSNIWLWCWYVQLQSVSTKRERGHSTPLFYHVHTAQDSSISWCLGILGKTLHT